MFHWEDYETHSGWYENAVKWNDKYIALTEKYIYMIYPKGSVVCNI